MEQVTATKRRPRLLIIGAALVCAVTVGTWWVIGSGVLSSGTITPAQLQGKWVGAGGASLDFTADGKFCAEKFPVQQDLKDRVTTCGTWELPPAGNGADQSVDLYFDKPSLAMTSQLMAAGEGGKDGLYVSWNPDDLSQRFDLKREG
ncbi:hypothetical protein ABT160_32855 [Streptomyces sp. NPDC001941]|uniref:hypothetical protein n=1 Tax=Streptomyces sp. NPDC001941 TaxID=3154659 RepID=UPI003330580A